VSYIGFSHIQRLYYYYYSNRDATHLSVILSTDDNEVRLLVQVLYFYLRLDPLGPLIDGDLVLQGSIVGTTKTTMSPSLCVVEKNVDEDQWKEVAVVSPDNMIITPPEDEGEDETRFMIPVRIPPEELGSVLRAKIYVQEASSVRYDGEAGDDFASQEKRAKMLLASTCSVGAVVTSAAWDNLPDSPQVELEKREEEEEEEKEHDTKSKRKGSGSSLQRFADLNTSQDLEDMAIQEIHIATDYDDVVALQSEGYQLQCIQVTPGGAVADVDFLWKVHIMSRAGNKSEGGLEDVQFIKCLKSLGTLPTLPFYKILHDYDLSSADDDVSS
jgi:hypothetical protein